METVQEKEKQRLKEQWKKACADYLNELLRMWELDAHYGFWTGDEEGTVYCYGETHNLRIDDIIYIVDADIEENEVLAWEDYLLDAHEFGFALPNLRAWHRGCSRTPPEVFERLRGMKADLKKAVEDEKDRLKMPY